MEIWAFIVHLANFILPALVVAGLLTPGVVGWRGLRLSGSQGRRLWRVWMVLSLVGVVALAAGLVGLGRDGKMLTYAALVLSQGTIAWWQSRGR